MTRAARFILCTASACLIALTLLPQATVFAQPSGRLFGVVTDETSGERLLGVNVLLVGSTLGTSTDIDGKFSIVRVPPGTYDVRLSSVGYATTIIRSVAIAEGTSFELNLQLAEEVISVDEIVVEATAINSSESAILAQRKKSATISDGISAEQIKRAPDATSGDALKRVTGLSVVDNKYVYVRGITDRYNSTTLDGASVTSTDAGKKSFSFDMVPANLLENTSVIKSATPDLPGDFSGGLVQLNTLDFPGNRVIKLNLGSSYNSVTTSQEFLRSQGGGKDWIGLDDGTRSFPEATTNLTQIAQAAANTWAPRKRSAPLNTSLSASIGDYVDLGETPADGQLGYIAALSYKNSSQRSEKLINDVALSRLNTGVKDNTSVLLGGIANLSYKFGGNHKLSLKNNLNISSDDEISRFDSRDDGVSLQNQYTVVSWTQRSTYTGQLTGEHNLPAFGGATIQWRTSVSSSRRDDPDKKEVTYYRNLDEVTEPYTAAVNRRSWAHLNERSYTVGSDLTLPAGAMKVRFGTHVESRTTNFGIRYFSITPDYFSSNSVADSLSHLPLDVIYAPENFGPGRFRFDESSRASDSYEGEQKIYAGYAMIDLPVGFLDNKLRFVGGVRAENAEQHVRVPRTLGVNGPADSTDLKKVDILPSFNLSYSALPNMNVRFAYSHSVNRPEFRELASTGFYDFVKYELVGGNPNLQRSFIHNYDVRVEIFPEIGELLAVSYFRKSISNAIEEQLFQSSTRTRTWFNSASASNDGWELEIRQSLRMFGTYLSNLSIAGNYTRIRSSVEVRETIGNSTNTQTVVSTRPLQGQSPYMVNLSVLFVEPDMGTAISIMYNKFGRRLEAVGFQTEDIYEEPRDLIDLSVTQPFFERFEAKLAIRNVTGKDRVLTRGGLLYDQSSTGSTYSLSVSVGL